MLGSLAGARLVNLLATLVLARMLAPEDFGVLAVPLLALGYIAYARVPTGFMPKADESGFVMDYYTPAGTSLIESSREMAEVDALLKANPDVETFSRRLGTGLGGDLGQSYHGDYFVRLKPDHSMPAEQAMNAATEARLLAREALVEIRERRLDGMAAEIAA